MVAFSHGGVGGGSSIVLIMWRTGSNNLPLPFISDTPVLTGIGDNQLHDTK